MLLSSLSPIFVQKTEIVCDVHILFSLKSNQNETNSEHLFIDKRPYTGGPQIVQILGSQGIVLLRNHTKRGLVLST